MDMLFLWIILISLGIFIFWVGKFMFMVILLMAWVFEQDVKKFFSKFRKKK